MAQATVSSKNHIVSPREARQALDFIYQLEAHVSYLAPADSVFAWVERAGHEAVTSTITVMELLVLSYRDPDENRNDEFYGLLST